MRHPLGVDGEETGQALDELGSLECGQAGALGGQVHAVHVHVRPENANLAIDAAVCLHALKELQGKQNRNGNRNRISEKTTRHH